MTESEQKFKVIIIGDSAVGKSSITARQCNNDFELNISSTIGSAHLVTTINVDGKDVSLVIWDTAGQEEFAPLVPMYARKASCAIIVASAVSNDSILHMKKWEEITFQNGEKPPIVAVINKIDLLESQDEQLKIEEQLKDDFQDIFFVSAKTGFRIGDLFMDVAMKCLSNSSKEIETPILKTKKKKGCC